MTQFITGEFQKFRAATSFHFGPLGMMIQEDTPIEFDGTTVNIGGGVHNCPKMSLAIKAGWIVPATDITSSYTPQAAGVQIHQAQSQGETRTPVNHPPMIVQD